MEWIAIPSIVAGEVAERSGRPVDDIFPK